MSNGSLPVIDETTETPTTNVYEPPKVETVLTNDELAREIQYAGVSAG